MKKPQKISSVVSLATSHALLMFSKPWPSTVNQRALVGNKGLSRCGGERIVFAVANARDPNDPRTRCATLFDIVLNTNVFLLLSQGREIVKTTTSNRIKIYI